MDFGPRSWAAAQLAGAPLPPVDLSPPALRLSSTCYQTIDPQPSRIPPTRRASRFLLDICCWVPRSPCSHNNPASNDNYYPSFSGRQQRSGKASPQTESSPSIATHSPTSYSSRTPGRPTPTHFPIASHPAPRAISARPAQRLPKNSALNLPKNKNNEQRPSDFLRQTAFFLFPHSRPPWLTRRTQTMSSTPSPC
jgi:hypothetical protein